LARQPKASPGRYAGCSGRASAGRRLPGLDGGQGPGGPALDLLVGAERGQLVERVPAGAGLAGVLGAERGFAVRGNGEVDEVDVLVARTDILELNAGGTHELAGIVDRQGALADQQGADAGLLGDLAQRRVLRQLGGLDVGARRPP